MVHYFFWFITLWLVFFSGSVSAQLNHFKSTEQSNIALPQGDPLPGNPALTYGLVFEKEYVYEPEDSSYTDKIQLISLSEKVQALQFRLLVNKAADDSTILIFEDLRKGSDISDSSWALDYNIFKGTVDSNGASKDEIYVLLYNVIQNGGLLPGNYYDLFEVDYKIVDLPDIKDSIKSSFKITNTQASTSQGDPIDITPSRDEFKIYAKVPCPNSGLWINF